MRFPRRPKAGILVPQLMSSVSKLIDASRRKQTTGLVFNCSRPAPPAALAAAFSQVALEA